MPSMYETLKVPSGLIPMPLLKWATPVESKLHWFTPPTVRPKVLFGRSYQSESAASSWMVGAPALRPMPKFPSTNHPPPQICTGPQVFAPLHKGTVAPLVPMSYVPADLTPRFAREVAALATSERLFE